MAVGAGSGGDSAGAATRESARAAPPVDPLSLRQQVGQLLVSSFDGTSVPAYLRAPAARGRDRRA